MKKREYFYTKNGKVLPYHYCSECDKRFTDEEFKQGLLIEVGLVASPLKFCKGLCFDTKFPKAVKKQPLYSVDYYYDPDRKSKPGRPSHA